jgi:hypothetical protein
MCICMYVFPSLHLNCGQESNRSHIRNQYDKGEALAIHFLEK